MRLTRRQRKERKARGLSVEPTILESGRSLFDTLDRIMPREILAPLKRLREMSAAGTPAEIAAGAERVMASVWTPRHGGGATLTVKSHRGPVKHWPKRAHTVEQMEELAKSIRERKSGGSDG